MSRGGGVKTQHSFKGAITNQLLLSFWTEESVDIKPKRLLQPLWHHEGSQHWDEEQRHGRKLGEFQVPGYSRSRGTWKEFSPYSKHNESSLKQVRQRSSAKRSVLLKDCFGRLYTKWIWRWEGRRLVNVNWVRVMSGKSEINGQTPEIRKNQNTRTW